MLEGPQSFEHLPVTEQEVVTALDAKGIEDAEAGALLERYVDQCHADSDAEAAADPDSAETSNRANIKADIKIATLYSKTEKYKELAIEALERAYESAGQQGSTQDLAGEALSLIEGLEMAIEKGRERILTKEEVLEAIGRYVENATFVRELSDEQGLYLLEVKIEGENPGETIQYEYMRKGRFPNNNSASETAIHMVHYTGEMPVGGEKVAVYNPETGEWKDVR